MKNISIGFFGDGKWAENLLEKLILDKTIFINFVCLRFNPSNQDLERLSKNNKIKTFKFKNVNSISSVKLLNQFDSDLFISMSYDQIFKEKVIDMPKYEIINCHAGKLPDYRGRNIINWAIINGDKTYGITTHFVDKKIDNGKILIQKQYRILDKDNYNTLLNKTYKRCTKVTLETIKKFQKNKLNPRSQKLFSGKRRYFKKRTSQDEFVDWEKTNLEIHNFIRGISPPAPGAKSKLGKNIIRFYKSSIFTKYKKRKNDKIGKIIKKTNKSIIISCIKGTIKILDWRTNAEISEGDIIK
tara:strand:- start:23 stop:919 length:897 start_codon:yes stop_codon:yes gene_type:complete